MKANLEQTAPAVAEDFLPLNGTDYVEFLVGNAKQSAYFYRAAFGMSLVAYQGPETGLRDRVSYVLQQGKVRFVLTTSLFPDGELADHVRRHGDGVRDIGLWVDDAESAWRETTKRGAKSIRAPFVMEARTSLNGKKVHGSSDGSVKIASIAIYGDTIHTFVERKNFSGAFLPGFVPIAEDPIARPTGLQYIDHMVGNVGWNEMNQWVDFYHKVMGFTLYQHFDDQDISTEYSALMSKVMANQNGRIKFPINEPAEGRKKSQIEEYLEYYHGPGVQHIAMATNNILETVGKLRNQGIEFLRVPHSYYMELQKRVGRIDEPVEELENLGILVDRDDEGYMLQIFTRPIEDRPTLFFEIIQRKGSRSFGKGNFKALFEAIEREQALRGNL
jgi:4-hydroxyphenylpyruvate dioxygenase